MCQFLKGRGHFLFILSYLLYIMYLVNALLLKSVLMDFVFQCNEPTWNRHFRLLKLHSITFNLLVIWRKHRAENHPTWYEGTTNQLLVLSYWPDGGPEIRTLQLPLFAFCNVYSHYCEWKCLKSLKNDVLFKIYFSTLSSLLVFSYYFANLILSLVFPVF